MSTKSILHLLLVIIALTLAACALEVTPAPTFMPTLPPTPTLPTAAPSPTATPPTAQAVELVDDEPTAQLATATGFDDSGGALSGVVLPEADFDSLPDDVVVRVNEAGQRVIKAGSGEVLFVETGGAGSNEWERVEPTPAEIQSFAEQFGLEIAATENSNEFELFAFNGDGEKSVFGLIKIQKLDSTGEKTALLLTATIKDQKVRINFSSLEQTEEGIVVVASGHRYLFSNEWEALQSVQEFEIAKEGDPGEATLQIIDETGRGLTIDQHEADFIYNMTLDAIAVGLPGGGLGASGESAWRQIQQGDGRVSMSLPFTEKVKNFAGKIRDMIQHSSREVNLQRITIRIVDTALIIGQSQVESQVMWEDSIERYGLYYFIGESGELEIVLVAGKEPLEKFADNALRMSWELLARLKERPDGEKLNVTGEGLTHIAGDAARNSGSKGFLWATEGVPSFSDMQFFGD